MQNRLRGMTEKFCRSAWNLLLAFLLALLFFQCALYIWQYASIRRTSADIPFNMKMLSSTSAKSTVAIDGKLLSPEVMAVSYEGECRALFHSTAVVEEMYANVGACLAEAFLESPERVEADVWQNAVAGDYVYAKYAGELPYQVVYALAAAQTGSEEQLRRADYVGVREILLSADADGALTTLLVRGESGVFRFALSGEKKAVDFSEQASLFDSVFTRASLVDNGSCCTVLLEDAVSVRPIYAAAGVTSLLIVQQDVLRLLNFNPDKLNYHVEPDDTVVYVESHGVFRVGEEDLVYQASEAGGISIDGLNGGDAEDIYAYLRVASYLIAQLAEQNSQFGGDAKLYLESVTGSGASVTMQFSFRCDNIAIVADTDYGLTLTFADGKLTALKYRHLIVRRNPEERRVFLQSWYKRMLGGDETADTRLVYALNTDSNMVSASWAVRVVEGGDTPWDG